ncbi:MAG: hypothetical protein IJE99_03760 [Alistipes sp.]|nr:hypothetical protein [Alistipes sp.]
MIGFRMLNIQVEQFAILGNDMPSGEIGFNTSLSFGVNPSIAGVRVTTRYELVSNEERLVILELSCSFEIFRENWDALIADGKLTLPKEFLAHLAMHSVGTARGVLFSKTEGTIFSQYILPPINIAERITEDITFDVPIDAVSE